MVSRQIQGNGNLLCNQEPKQISDAHSLLSNDESLFFCSQFNNDLPKKDEFKRPFAVPSPLSTTNRRKLRLRLSSTKKRRKNLASRFDETIIPPAPVEIETNCDKTAGKLNNSDYLFETQFLETEDFKVVDSIEKAANSSRNNLSIFEDRFFVDVNLTSILNNRLDSIELKTECPEEEQTHQVGDRSICTEHNLLTPIRKSVTHGYQSPGTVFRSNKNNSEYIQIQQKMKTENDDNLNDDDFIDSDLSQAYKSNEYRHEIERIFNECERTICELNESTDQVESDNGLELKISDQKENKSPSVVVQQRIEQFRQGRTNGSPKVLEQINGHLLKPVSTSLFRSRGPFFGLPNKVKSLIKEFKGIDQLYDWQIECLCLPAITQRTNLIYALPTSGGKTLVAEIIMLREIICRQKNCLFILPYVSIVQEKLWAMSPFAVQMEFLVEEYAAGKGRLPPRKRREKRSVYIATIEKGLALLDSLIECDRANEIGLIVVDELHIVGEMGRGAALESLLTKAMYIDAGIQIIGMSATIGNLNEVAKFLSADVYTRNFRPVELREYIKCGRDILEIKPNYGPDEAFQFVRKVNFSYEPKAERMDPDHITGLISEIIPNESCLIFCSTKKNCEHLSLLLSQMLPMKHMEHRREEKEALVKAIEIDSGPLCPTLEKTIPYGIAYHHSGLTSDDRRHLEDAFRLNILCVICCTSTLAAGVNLPARRVIIRSPYVGRGFLTLSRYKQMIGRAGRAGMCGDNGTGESILICSLKDNVRISNLLLSPMDVALSNLHTNGEKGVRAFILSAIGLQLATNRKELHGLISKTLFAVQSERFDINPKQLIDNIVKDLIKSKSLVLTESSDLSTTTESVSVLSTTIDSQSLGSKNVIIKPTTKLTISSLGRASFKSCIELQRAETVYKDLVRAQNALVLSDYFHLLYLVTPYEPDDIAFQPDMSIYYRQYSKLNAQQLHTAGIIGMTEACASRMISGKPFKGELHRIVYRFFFTLILYDLWQMKPVHEVAKTFNIDRGIVQNLLSTSASFSSSMLKFCEELDEFWAFKELFGLLTKRLSYCCSAELMPLMELPCVQLGRAKQLYTAGFKTIEAIARSNATDLVQSIENLSNRVARQMISAAKVILLERVETLREEVQDCLDVLHHKK